MLLVGTSKGAFILDGDADRRSWSIRGPLCDGWPIHDLNWDPATSSIYAGGGSPWYGPAVFRSDDLGETWKHSSEGLTYGDDGRLEAPAVGADENVLRRKVAMNERERIAFFIAVLVRSVKTGALKRA